MYNFPISFQLDCLFHTGLKSKERHISNSLNTELIELPLHFMRETPIKSEGMHGVE